MIILENTKEYKDTKLAIPVGIGVVQTESVKNFYNTSDADATSADILIDKVAYGKYGKLTGTLDLNAEKEISYQDGYETGKTDGYDSGYEIGKTDGYDSGYDIGYGNGYTEGETNGYTNGYTEGETNGYNNGYNIGVADGVVEGKNEIIEGQSDATITPQNVLRGYVGYGKNNERIVGDSDAITTIDVAASGIKFGYSAFTEIPSYYDFNNVSNMSHMFDNCEKLLSVPFFDTSKVTNMSHMFYYCRVLSSVPQFDTSKVINMEYMFNFCNKLTSVPLLNTSNVTTMKQMFNSCSNLTSVPLFDTSNVKYMDSMFYNCSNLTSVPKFDTSKVTNMNQMFSGCSKLTSVSEFDLSGMIGNSYNCTQIFGTSNYVIDFGGFKDLGKAYQNSNNSYIHVMLQSQAKLSYQSCMNVINKVYDLTLKPDYTNTPKIRFHATPYALLSADDIAIATAKGWAVQAG